MTIAFPTIRPTDLTLVLAKLPIATHGWQGVWEAPALAGSVPVDARLDLSYQNITTADAAALLVCWRTSGSGLFALNALPPEVVAGVVNADLAAWIRQPPGLKWTWAEAPQHTAVKSHRATVTVRLVGELR